MASVIRKTKVEKCNKEGDKCVLKRDLAVRH